MLSVTPNADAGSWDGTTTVSGSDFTTTSTNLVDITGLVTPTLLNSQAYEFELVATTQNSTSAGFSWAVHGGGTGTAATVMMNDNSGASFGGTAAIDTAVAGSTATSAVQFYIRGHFTTRSTGTATFSIQARKTTSGTFTCFVGSQLKWRALQA